MRSARLLGGRFRPGGFNPAGRQFAVLGLLLRKSTRVRRSRFSASRCRQKRGGRSTNCADQPAGACGFVAASGACGNRAIKRGAVAKQA